MPWRHQMVLPYLIPRELPESELQQLALFARGFVRRNGHDLTDTMLNMTRTLHGKPLREQAPVRGLARLCGTQLRRRHADFRDDRAELTGRPLP